MATKKTKTTIGEVDNKVKKSPVRKPRVTEKVTLASDKKTPARKPRTRKQPTVMVEVETSIGRVVEEVPAEDVANTEREPALPVAAAVEPDKQNPDNYKHMTRSENWDTNRSILLSVGATEAQANELSNRKFSALPLWARKRIKRLMRQANRAAATSNEQKGSPMRTVKSYFFRHASREELQKLAAQFPPKYREPHVGRDVLTNRLLIGDVLR